MATTKKSFFKNKYTVGIDDPPAEFGIDVSKRDLKQMKKTLQSVVNYLAEYVKWESKLSFGLTWHQHDTKGSSGAASMGGFYSKEILGEDYYPENKYDSGAMIFVDNTGFLGLGSWPFDFSKKARKKPDLPTKKGTSSFFNVVLHEIVHGMGGAWMEGGKDWSLPIKTKNGVDYVISPEVKKILPSGLPLSKHDAGCHYAPDFKQPLDEILFGGLMWDGREVHSDDVLTNWNHANLSKLDLAIFEDLGYEINKNNDLPILSVEPDGLMEGIQMYADLNNLSYDDVINGIHESYSNAI